MESEDEAPSLEEMEREVDSDGSDDEEEEGTEDNDFMPDFSFSTWKTTTNPRPETPLSQPS